MLKKSNMLLEKSLDDAFSEVNGGTRTWERHSHLPKGILHFPVLAPPPLPCSPSYHSLAHHCCPCSHQHHCTQPTVGCSGSSFDSWILYGCHTDGSLKREERAKSELNSQSKRHLPVVIWRTWCLGVTITNWIDAGNMCLFQAWSIYQKQKASSVSSLAQYHSFLLQNYRGRGRGRTGLEAKNTWVSALYY